MVTELAIPLLIHLAASFEIALEVRHGQSNPLLIKTMFLSVNRPHRGEGREGEWKWPITRTAIEVGWVGGRMFLGIMFITKKEKEIRTLRMGL